MRAVNLIPADARGSGPGPRTGRAPYALLGALALLVVLVGAWAMAGRGLDQQRAELAQLQAEATAAQARLGGLAQYGQYAALRQARFNTVSTLAASRFDWSRALDELSRTLPDDAWLTSITGTVAPGVSVEGGGQSALRGALPQPAIELVGCTTSQSRLAQLMARLRAVPDVSRVTLSDAAKIDRGDTGAGGDSDADCRGGRASYPKFAMVLFFGDAATAPATTAAAAAPAADSAPAAAPQATGDAQ
jgi:Tfp pilus assembly protein PilN